MYTKPLLCRIIYKGGLFAWILFFAHSAIAQSKIPDTLTKAEIGAIDYALKYSSFWYNTLADSFSRKNDTINASKWLLRVNPYYIAWYWNEYEYADSILKHYKANKDASQKFRQFFDSAMLNQTESFKQFKAMREEDQAVRNVYEKCGDSVTCANAQKKLLHTDSVHFNYLNDYVKKNGWPTIENGSLFACLIAIHDHRHHNDYVPVLKKAILDGEAPLEPLKLILYWKSQEGPKDIKALLDSTRHIQFDVSSIFQHQLPVSLPRIKEAMRLHCKAKKYIVLEARDKKVFDAWLITFHRWSNVENDDGISDLFDALRGACNDPRRKWAKGTWDIYYMPSDRLKERMVLYLVF